MELARQKTVGLVGIAALVIVPTAWLAIAVGLAGRIRFEPAKLAETPEQKRAAARATVRGAATAALVQPQPKPAATTPAKPAEAKKAPAPPAPPPIPEPAFDGNASALNRLITRARQLENTQPSEARRLLRSALAADPKNERALRSLAAKLLLDEDFQGALAMSQRCVQVNPTNPVCIKVSRALPKDAAALETQARLMAECLKADPQNFVCRYGEFSAHLLRKTPLKALAAAAALGETAPSSGLAETARARLLAMRGNYGAARVLFDSACGKASEPACFRADILRNEGF